MRALALNCTLKRLPEDSNTAALTRGVVDALQQRGVETALLRVVDYVVEPGVVSEALPPMTNGLRCTSRSSRLTS